MKVSSGPAAPEGTTDGAARGEPATIEVAGMSPAHDVAPAAVEKVTSHDKETGAEDLSTEGSSPSSSTPNPKTSGASDRQPALPDRPGSSSTTQEIVPGGPNVPLPSSAQVPSWSQEAEDAALKQLQEAGQVLFFFLTLYASQHHRYLCLLSFHLVCFQAVLNLSAAKTELLKNLTSQLSHSTERVGEIERREAALQDREAAIHREEQGLEALQKLMDEQR